MNVLFIANCFATVYVNDADTLSQQRRFDLTPPRRTFMLYIIIIMLLHDVMVLLHNDT